MYIMVMPAIPQVNGTTETSVLQLVEALPVEEYEDNDKLNNDLIQLNKIFI
jgi:hypothetical protein